MAIHTMVQDLAEYAGVPVEHFVKHFGVRFRWWHDYYLRQIEDLSPALAAQLDPRTVEQAHVEDTYPSIFDPPSGDQPT